MVSSLFDRWWSNFIQWCIIIVPLLFSLWLAGWFMELGETCSSISGLASRPQEVRDALSGKIICEASVQVFALGALIVGIMMSMSFSAAGSKLIINRSKDYYKRSVKGTARWAEKQAYLRGPGLVSPVSKKIAGTRVGRAGKAIGRTPGLQRLVAPVVRRGAAKREKYLSEWKKNKDYDGFSSTALRQALNYERDGGRRAKIIDLLSGKVEAFNEHIDNLNPKEREKFDREIKAREITHPGSAKKVLELRPDIAKSIGKEMGKVVAEAMDKSIRNWSPKIFADPEIVKALVEQGKFTKQLTAYISRDPQKLRSLETSLQKAFGPAKDMRELLEKIPDKKSLDSLKYSPHVSALFDTSKEKSPGEIMEEGIEDMKDTVKKGGGDKKDDKKSKDDGK